MSVENEDEICVITEYVKSANLKGSVEVDNDEFLWDLDGIYLRFAIDVYESTVFYSRQKNQLFEIGHFHVDNSDVIDLIKDINSEDNIVHITVCPFWNSFRLVNKTDKKKKSWLIVRHYYSLL